MHGAKVDRMGPVLVGGLVGGVASGIPGLSALNCCCCSLYIIGGLVAGIMYARGAAKLNVFPTAGQGFFTGGIAGALAGVLATLLQAVIGLTLRAAGLGMDPEQALEQAREGLDQLRQEMPELADALEQFIQLSMQSDGVFGILLSVVFWVTLGFVFGGLGGAIGNAISRKPPAAPAAPAAPPPPAAPTPPSAPAGV